MAQYDKSSDEILQKTEKLPGNELSIFDMNGNAFEWILSPDDLENAFVIGGCFLSDKKEVEAIVKNKADQNTSYCISGFRCVIDFSE